MIFHSLESMAALRHNLHVFILFCLLGAFLVPWVAAIIDGIKASKKPAPKRKGGAL
jgi:hypothetical protein